MSGFEVVGVVLGVLPLIISAIEHYNDIVDPIVTFRKYSRELQTFMTELNVQRDIFQNECIWILSRFIDGHELQDMLKSPTHHLRSGLKQDVELQQKVSNSIGAHASQLKDILELINSSLNDIYAEVEHLPQGLAKPTGTSNESVDIKAWRSRVKQKLKLAFRKDSLNRKVDDLRNRNQAFLAFSQQIIRFNASWGPTQTSEDIKQTDKSLAKIHKLRRTSQTLHRHVDKILSCSAHKGHTANLRLCLETSELYKDIPPKVSFELTLTHGNEDVLESKSQDILVLTFESSIETATAVVNKKIPAVQIQETDDQAFEPGPFKRQTSAGLQRKERERVGHSSRLRGMWTKLTGAKGNEPIASSGARQKTSNLPVRQQPAISFLQEHEKARKEDERSLDHVDDLCSSLLEISKRRKHTVGECIGSFTGENSESYKVYLKNTALSAPSEALSLAKLIMDLHKQQVLPRPDKWRLAGALSLALLLYHSTPWLRADLKSEDMFFFGPGGSDFRSAGFLKNPHLHSGQTKAAPEPASLGNMVQFFREQQLGGFVKNEALFKLGLLLLEIEFEDTLENLLVESKMEGLAELTVPLTQRFMLLKRQAGTQLGTRYGRIVRMCLNCDFGLGLDEYSLGDTRVQEIFYSQVIQQFQDRMPEYSRIWSDD